MAFDQGIVSLPVLIGGVWLGGLENIGDATVNRDYPGVENVVVSVCGLNLDLRNTHNRLPQDSLKACRTSLLCPRPGYRRLFR
jgi:hypothetical protein